jgi:hypothetical protein
MDLEWNLPPEDTSAADIEKLSRESHRSLTDEQRKQLADLGRRALPADKVPTLRTLIGEYGRLACDLPNMITYLDQLLVYEAWVAEHPEADADLPL